MKFARVRTAAGVRPVVVADDVAYDLSDRLADLDPRTLPGLADVKAAVRAGQLPTVDLDGADFDAPVRGVGAVIAIGMNYAAHAAESGAAPPAAAGDVPQDAEHGRRPERPGPDPARRDKLDWEVELALVIGRRACYLDSTGQSARLRRRLHRRQRPVRADVPARGVRRAVEQGQVLPGVRPRSGLGWSPPTRWTTRALRLRSWVNGEPRQDSSHR